MRTLGFQTVIFSLGNEEYGFPIEMVQEITSLIDIHPLPEAPPYIKGLINIRGQALPLVDLNKKFGLEDESKNNFAIIVEINDSLVAIAVDEVKEIRTFEKVEPPPALITVPFISGIINLANRMIIQIRPENLLEDNEIKDLIKLVG